MSNEKLSGKKGSGLLVLTGISLGVLVGLCMGLSASPIVSTIVGTLTSLLTTFVGLKLIDERKKGVETQTPQEGERPETFRLKLLLLSSFSITCILSALTGIYIRTHNLLSQSLSDKTAYWEKAGFSKSEIKKIILFQELGVLDEKGIIDDGGKAIVAEAKGPGSGSSVLFSGEIDENICDVLQYVNEKQTVAQMLEEFRTNGGKLALWANAIDQHIQQVEKKNALLALKETLCELKGLHISDSDCKEFQQIDSATSIEDAKNIAGGENKFFTSLLKNAGLRFKDNGALQLLFIRTILSETCNK